MQKDANSPELRKRIVRRARVWKWLLASILVVLLFFMSLVLPVIVSAQRKARFAMAAVEMACIQKAILAYESTYGKLPISERNSRERLGDFTFGTVGIDSKTQVQNPTARHQANNSEMMAILLDMTSFRDGYPTVNMNHTLNPRRIEFLNAKQTQGNQSPGIGEDGVYRDPWGNPYIITLDVNGDGFCDDPLYGKVRQKVFVWSFGPDARADLSLKPNESVNQDNIITAP